MAKQPAGMSVTVRLVPRRARTSYPLALLALVAAVLVILALTQSRHPVNGAGDTPAPRPAAAATLGRFAVQDTVFTPPATFLPWAA